MFSPLARGYGSWTGGQVDPYGDEKDTCSLPYIEGIEPTVRYHELRNISSKSNRTPRATPLYQGTQEFPRPKTQGHIHVEDDGHLDLPKTFVTRKGALMLFTGPDDLLKDGLEGEQMNQRWLKHKRKYKDILDLSLNLKTLDRLALSVLQYGGDQEYDREHTSISDEKNKVFLSKVMKKMDQKEVDVHARPGADLNFYLRDLKSSSSARYTFDGNTYIPKSRESQELQAILRGLDSNWPPAFSSDGEARGSHSDFTRPVSRASTESYMSVPPSTPRSFHVLSAKKLAASIKSTKYLGRTSTEDTPDVELTDEDLSLGPQPVTKISFHHGGEGDMGSAEDLTLPLRDKLFTMSRSQSIASSSIAEEETDSDRKRRNKRERVGSPKMSLIMQASVEDDDDYLERTKKDLSRILSEGTGSILENGSGRPPLAGYQADVPEGSDGTSARDSMYNLDTIKHIAQSMAPKTTSKPTSKKKMARKGSKSALGDAKVDARKRQAEREKLVIPEHMQDALGRQPLESLQALEGDLERKGFLKDGKVTDLVNESLSGPTLEAIGEGLTEEELEIAKQILQAKIEAAKKGLDGKEVKKPTKAKTAEKGKKGKKKGAPASDKDDKQKEHEELKEQQRLEHAKRNEEKLALQKRIAEQRAKLNEQTEKDSEATSEIQEEMDRLEREAENLQAAEDDARQILAEQKRLMREEREQRRKADAERRRQDAIERREREKKLKEAERTKEKEMLERIADAEMRRRLEEEEARKRDEEERLAQEQMEEELKEAQRLAEEEEERLRQLEREAEEAEIERITREREEAERQRRLLAEEQAKLKLEQDRQRALFLQEQRRLEEEQRKREEEEELKLNEEKQRLAELKRLEEEARLEMQREVEARRQDAIMRRDRNIEAKQNVDKLRHYQGITRPWVFSYFVRWPRETYEKPIGFDPRKAVIKNLKVKKPAEGGDVPSPQES